MEIKARVEQLLAAIEEAIGYGYGRWQDEKKYEKIEDYAVLYAKKAKALGWTITRMTSNPYGFHATHEEAKLELQVTVRGSLLSWRARPVGTDPKPIERFQLKTLIAALKLEQKGMTRSRRPSALAIAKTKTGLKTNDRAKQIAKLQEMAHG